MEHAQILLALAFTHMYHAVMDQPDDDETREKNPAAVALGRLGGRRGGVARAAGMTAQERSEAARKAAKARWGRSKVEPVEENEHG